jgi:pimeloyl-ACP methyl ester carboxylesterase
METCLVDGRVVAFHRLDPSARPGATPASRTALCLHGFPDEAGSLLPVAERLVADGGFRVFVPAMPGYAPSAALLQAGPHRVAAHLLAFADALGLASFHVLGHDWGAVAAYTLANLAPDRVAGVAALSVPPPGVFARNLLRHPGQLLRSRYMGQFQVPGLSERFVRRDDHAFIETLWRRWSPGFTPPPERLAAVKAALGAPGALAAALDYYRALRDPRAWVEGREVVFRRICAPTLVMTGADDACIAPEMFEGLAPSFLGPFDFTRVPGAGHFLPLEAPDTVAARVLGFWDTHTPATAAAPA